MELPDELQLVLLSKLRYTDVTRAACVCRTFKQILLSDEIWRIWWFGEFKDEAPERDVRTLFKERVSTFQFRWCEHYIIRRDGFIFIINKTHPQGCAIALPTNGEAWMILQTKADPPPQWIAAPNGKLTRNDEYLQFPNDRELLDSVPRLQSDMPSVCIRNGFELLIERRDSGQIMHVRHPRRTGWEIEITDSANGWLHVCDLRKQAPTFTIWTVHNLDNDPISIPLGEELDSNQAPPDYVHQYYKHKRIDNTRSTHNPPTSKNDDGIVQIIPILRQKDAQQKSCCHIM